MGEQRIGLLESLLPGDAWVIGIDEQTAVVIDLEEQTAAVSGKGGVTVRHGGVSRGIDHGATVPLAALVPDAMDATRPAPLRSPVKTEDTQLTFREAVAAGDLDRAASIALAAVDAEDPAALRSMIAALADVATARPAFDPVEVADPFVRALLDIRTAVRSEKRWDLSDLIRDRVAAVSIVVRDTPDGPTWEFA
jgi:hypothetical protein